LNYAFASDIYQIGMNAGNHYSEDPKFPIVPAALISRRKRRSEAYIREEKEV